MFIFSCFYFLTILFLLTSSVTAAPQLAIRWMYLYTFIVNLCTNQQKLTGNQQGRNCCER